VSSVAIRRVHPGDADATALVAEFFAEIASRYPEFDPQQQPAAPLHAFTEELGGEFVIAVVDGSMGGCGGLQRLDDETGEIRRIFVREHARGRGVGRAVLRALVASARRFGYSRVRLDTGDRLPEAVALFRSFGFVEIGDYNGNPFAAFWMELDLRADVGGT
jgi:GNAT superfamily N-acetyltransferase